MNRIFVLGSVNMDMVMQAERMPLEGETISGTGFLLNAGGKGANQAVAVKKSGGSLKFCANVGDDVFGEQLVNTLREYKVDTENVRTIAGTNSGLAQITVVNGDNRIILYGGANENLDAEAAEKFLAEAAKGDIFLTQLEIAPAVVLASLKTAKERGMQTILNPAPAQNFRSEMLKFTDIIIPNEAEARCISGKEEVEEAARLMSEIVREVIVTVGEKGCIYCCGNSLEAFPCPRVKVVDTTAAGDTFCGAFAARLSRGYSVKEAIGYAQKAASLAVTKSGALQSIPSESEVLKTTFRIA